MRDREEKSGEVVSVNISEKKGTVKYPVPQVTIDEEGVVEDAHRGRWHRQVSMLALESIRLFSEQMGRQIEPGEFAENITTSGLSAEQVALLDHFRAGEVELELTQIGKECHGEECGIYREVGRCVMPREGLFCRVVEPGAVRPGDEIRHLRRTFHCRVITISDRASRGERGDRSGPGAVQLLEELFAGTRWRTCVERSVVPDETGRIRAEVKGALERGDDVVVTTGGTGIGPRDVTPEAIGSLLEKRLPGLMEHIRTRFGRQNPNALLSRGLAGTAGNTLIYALPGSTRAVEEYLGEILPTVEHSILMLHEVPAH